MRLAPHPEPRLPGGVAIAATALGFLVVAPIALRLRAFERRDF